jgi:hypothetical protein
MNLKTFENKKIIDGVVAMTEPTLLFSSSSTEIIDKIIVGKEYACRIDLLAKRYYGDASYADYLLKYNNISNPFTIGEGDILLIPSIKSGLINFKKPVDKLTEEDGDVIRDKFLKTKRLPIEDQKRIEYLKRKAAQYPNGASEILPPNVLKTGGANVTIKDGVIKLNGTIDLTK